MKITVNIEEENPREDINSLTYGICEQILSLLSPISTTATIVLSADALNLLKYIKKTDDFQMRINESAGSLYIKSDYYKYVVNPDFEGIIFEVADSNGYVKTIKIGDVTKINIDN